MHYDMEPMLVGPTGDKILKNSSGITYNWPNSEPMPFSWREFELKSQYPWSVVPLVMFMFVFHNLTTFVVDNGQSCAILLPKFIFQK